VATLTLVQNRLPIGSLVQLTGTIMEQHAAAAAPFFCSVDEVKRAGIEIPVCIKQTGTIVEQYAAAAAPVL